MVHDFLFNGERASAHGIILEDVPAFAGGAERGEWVTIKGMSGSRWRSDGSLDSVDIKMNIYVQPWADLNDVIGFMSGSGRLVIEPLPWYWDARVFKMPAFAGWAWDGEGWRGSLTFRCRPHRYMYPESATLTFTGAGFVHNPCNAESEPIIVVRGSGDGVINVGGWTVNVSNLTEPIVLDCEAKIAYVLGTQTSAATQVSTSGDSSTEYAGSWPRLVPGRTDITFGGGIESITITPRWRWK